MTPEQQSALSSTLTANAPQASQVFQNILGPIDQNQLQDMFQQAYVDPAMKAYQESILPSIQQRFVDANASSSSALNQALAQSASDLSTSLGLGYGQLFQNAQTQQLQGLNQFLPLLTNQTFSPLIQQQQGILGPLVQAGGAIGAGLAMSSREVKENIKDYHRGLDVIEKLSVKKYDYTPKIGPYKNKIGVIAEDVPSECTQKVYDVLCVDTYALIGLLINSVKELSQKVTRLESEKCLSQ